MDFYNFYTGKEFEAYEYLGAHTYFGGVTFRTFAPAATHVSLIGDFNGWQEMPMNKVHDGNFWEISVNGIMAGSLYKYRIYKRDGCFTDHADPYGYYAELRPATASIIYDIKAYQFNDSKWMAERRKLFGGPINIYEVHLGSWKRKKPEVAASGSDSSAAGSGSSALGSDSSTAGSDSFSSGSGSSQTEGGETSVYDTEPYSYDELAQLLIPYLKENGYNFLEIMPINEYPCDESWGYQSTGYFSPTSRYGEPDALRRLIDACHRENIAVILDFIPVHFAVNDYGLKEYDGTPLFEYPNNAVGYNEWGSCNFMHSRGETCSFLQSAANFWLSEYHFDGLRMDAVGNLIYWQGNPSRGENKSAIQFLQVMNSGLKARHPDALLFAEDSSSREKTTAPVFAGGLGFDFKWDLGWMHDTLAFFQAAPKYRSSMYHKLTFSMMYFYNEHYILPLSHDEVVHGKATIVQKMSDLYEGKFRQARAFYMYMYAHPGKKLNFMGNEIGQLREWDEKREQDWDMLKYPMHDSFRHFMAELNHLYLDKPALYGSDYDNEGFEWVDCHQESRCIYVFLRKCGGQKILCVFNFSDWEHEYQLYLNSNTYEKKTVLKPLLHSDWEKFSGKVKFNDAAVEYSDGITLKLPAFSAQFFELAEG